MTASPFSAAILNIKVFALLILSLLVHHLNFGLGAGYPFPIKFTQKVSSMFGINKFG